MHRTTTRSLAAVFAALTALAPTAAQLGAQGVSQAGTPASPSATDKSGSAPAPVALRIVPGTQMVSVNPLGLMFGVASADYERVESASSTIGGDASLYSNGDFNYFSADAKYRYYLNGTALRGFSMAGSLGLTHIGVSGYTCDFTCGTTTSSGNAVGFGVDLSYQWLLGARSNVGVNLGLGAKKLFVIGTEVAGASLTLPTGRLGIGYGF